jgi:hypothetical protein
MDWKRIKNTGCIVVGGVSYDLSHLNDVKYSFTVPATGKHSEITFEILTQYSSHCMSWGPSRNQEIDFLEQGEDRRIIDDKGIHRCFCDNRYKLSKQLPSIFSTLIDKKCYFTGHDNWLIIEISDSSGYRQEYEIFFSVTKQSNKLLRIYVESAYVRGNEYPGNRPKKFKRRDKVTAKVLLTKKLRCEPIRQPHNGRRRR